MNQEHENTESGREVEEREALRSTQRPAMLFLVVDVALFALFMIQLFAFVYEGAEDAYISYRVARNCARGVGFVYNPGEYVEAVSNPLWTLALALFYWLGADMRWAGEILVVSCSALFFLLLRRTSLRLFGGRSWLARFPLLAAVCATHLPLGFGNMLEGSAVALAAAVIAWCAVARKPLGLALAATVLMVLRPEAPLYAVAIGLWIIFEAWRGRFTWVAMWRYMALTASALLTIILARAVYFGDIVPNTVRAKVPPPGGSVHWAGAELVREYLVYVGPVLLLFALIGFFNAKRRPFVTLCWLLPALNLLTVIRPGDWMIFRLMTPLLPFIVFAAASGMEVIASRRRFLGMAAAVAGIASAVLMVRVEYLEKRIPAWTDGLRSLAHPLGERSAPPGYAETYSISPHITNLDFGHPDDRVVVECGSGPGWKLDGVTVLEMWGLADRDLVQRYPQMQRRTVGGVCNWPAIQEKRPTCYFLADQTSNTVELLKTPGCDVGGGFVVFRHSGEPEQATFMTLSSHEVIRMALLDYGSFFPAEDYFTCSEPLTSDSLTAWQRTPWVDGNGAQYRDEWRDWNGVRRFSAMLPADENGAVSFSRELRDNTPIVLFFGIPPDSGFRGQLHIVSPGLDGDDKERRTTVPVAGAQGAMPVFALWLSMEHARMGDTLTIEVQMESPGPVYFAANRWPCIGEPALPTPFVQERFRQEERYFEEHGDAGKAANARSALEALSAVENTPESSITKRTALFHGAQPLRDALRAHPHSASARDALRAYYRDANAPRENMLEWAGMTNFVDTTPEVWAELILAQLECGDMRTIQDTAMRFWTLTLFESPLRAHIVNRMEQCLRTELESSESSDADSLMKALRKGMPPGSIALMPLFARVEVLDSGDANDTLDDYESAVALYPNESTPEERERIGKQMVHDLAEPLKKELNNAERVVAVAGTCMRLRKLDPDNLDNLDTLSAALFKIAPGAKALETCRELVAQFPDHYPGFERLARFYLTNNDLDGLLKEWLDYTAAHPDAHLGWFSLGLAYERRHEYGKAAEAYRHALTFNPGAQGSKEALERVLKQ